MGFNISIHGTIAVLLFLFSAIFSSFLGTDNKELMLSGVIYLGLIFITRQIQLKSLNLVLNLMAFHFYYIIFIIYPLILKKRYNNSYLEILVEILTSIFMGYLISYVLIVKETNENTFKK